MNRRQKPTLYLFLAVLACSASLNHAFSMDSTSRYHEIDGWFSAIHTNKEHSFRFQNFDLRYGFYLRPGTGSFRYGTQVGLSACFFSFPDIQSGHFTLFKDMRNRELFMTVVPKISYHRPWAKLLCFAEFGFSTYFPLYAEGKRISVNTITGEETHKTVRYKPGFFILPEISAGIRLPKNCFHLGARIIYSYDFRRNDGTDNSRGYSSVRFGVSLGL